MLGYGVIGLVALFSIAAGIWGAIEGSLLLMSGAFGFAGVILLLGMFFMVMDIYEKIQRNEIEISTKESAISD